jgi:hypothetical protein
MSYTLSHGQLFNLAKSSWRMGFSPSSIPTRQLGSGGHCHPEHGTKTLPNSTKTRDHQKNTNHPRQKAIEVTMSL